MFNSQTNPKKADEETGEQDRRVGGGFPFGKVMVLGAGVGTGLQSQQETPKQRARRLGIPYVEPIKSAPYKPSLPNQPIAVCGGCGRDVYAVEGYSCPQGNCPIQPKIFSLSC